MRMMCITKIEVSNELYKIEMINKVISGFLHCNTII